MLRFIWIAALVFGWAAAACATPVLLSERDRADHVFFEGGGDALDSAARDQLDRLSSVLQSVVLANTCLKLVGHADVGGAADANMELGKRRAETVALYILERMPVGSIWIETTSAGETAPLAVIPPDDPRQRRVEILARRCTT